MKRPSKAKLRWQTIEAGIQAFELNEFRQFYAAAAKFLIDSVHWDDSHPETEFDENVVVKQFHAGFDQFSKGKMLGLEEHRIGTAEANLLELLKQASEWDGKKLHRRVAGRKLTRLRQRLKKSLLRFCRPDTREENAAEVGEAENGTKVPQRRKRGLGVSFQGFLFYEFTIRGKYISKRKITRK